MEDRTLKDLNQFTGSEIFVPYTYGGLEFKFSEGAHHIADVGKSYWMIDKILKQHLDFVSRNKQQVINIWELIVKTDKTGCLKCTDQNGNLMYYEPIKDVSFPFCVSLWLVGSFLILPTEYEHTKSLMEIKQFKTKC